MDATEIVVLVAVAALLAWEIVTVASAKDKIRTISDVVMTACKRNPVLILLIGILAGHWLWQYCPPCS